MALIGDMQYLTIGGNTYSIPVGGSTVQVEQNLTSGTKTATITVDGTPYELFAPSTVTETDPVFSASAAANITSTDISNWNNKVSDDKTWNGVTLNKSVTTVTSDLYIPCTISTSSTAAYLIKALDSSYSGGSIARRTSAGYLVAQTPSANDNSTKVATTAYVDAAIPDVSGFSTTDEKLKINAVSDTDVYYPIFGSNSTSGASTQLYDNNFKYQSATWATLTLGSLNGKKGNWQIFNGSYYIDLQPATLTSARTIYFPDKDGTVALTSDIPDTSGFISKSGDTMTGNLAFADGKGITLNYDGQTDTLRLIGYGSNFRVANFSTQTILRNIYTPDSDNAAANKKYVDDKFASITIPTSTGSATTGISISDHSSTTIYGVQSTTTSVTGVSGSTTASKVTVGTSSTDYGITAAGSGSATLTFTMDTTDTKKLKITFSHTHTAPTLGSKVPTVSASNVTVPIAAASATTVPIKNTSSTTVITSGTHSVTDTGHTHTI